MAVDNFGVSAPPSSDAILVRRLLSDAAWASLGTIDRVDGAPSVSLVQIALNEQGSPLLLISELASHTRNLRRDARASLLIDRRTQDPAAAAVERVTLIGRARPSTSDADRARFLARHPEAARYAGFGDFGIWEMAVERVHLVAGFGRIRALQPAEIVCPRSSAWNGG